MDWEQYYHINWDQMSNQLILLLASYSQIDKETLAIVFGVKHFHQYLLGRQFIIKSDHKPLQHLFGEKKGIPDMASARDRVGHAPESSPLTCTAQGGAYTRGTGNVVRKFGNFNCDGAQIKHWTDHDPVLAKLFCS